MKFASKYFIVGTPPKYDYINKLLFFDVIRSDLNGSPTSDITRISLVAPLQIKSLIGEGDLLRIWNFYVDIAPKSKDSSNESKEISIGYKIDRYNKITNLWDYVYEEIRK